MLGQVKVLHEPTSFTHTASKLAVSFSKHCITQLQMHAGGLSLMRDRDYVTYGGGWTQ